MLEKIVQELRKLGLNEIEIGNELFWRGYTLDECEDGGQVRGWKSAKVEERWLLAHDPALMGEE